MRGFGRGAGGGPAGRVGAGGGFGNVAGHVHLEVESVGGRAAVEVYLAGADGHGHGLSLKVSILQVKYDPVAAQRVGSYRSIRAADACECLA